MAHGRGNTPHLPGPASLAPLTEGVSGSSGNISNESENASNVPENAFNVSENVSENTFDASNASGLPSRIPNALPVSNALPPGMRPYPLAARETLVGYPDHPPIAAIHFGHARQDEFDGTFGKPTDELAAAERLDHTSRESIGTESVHESEYSFLREGLPPYPQAVDYRQQYQVFIFVSMSDRQHLKLYSPVVSIPCIYWE